MDGQRAEGRQGRVQRRQVSRLQEPAIVAALPLASGAGIEWQSLERPRAWRGRLLSGPGPGSAVHAAGYPRQRRIVLDAALSDQPAELARIATHELFHFAWFRLGNQWRAQWQQVLLDEFGRRARGELGWSAEWRKRQLGPADRQTRTRRWREYLCESFCDTAAWLYSGVQAHPEYTLKPGHRERRRAWFDALLSHFPAGLRI